VAAAAATDNQSCGIPGEDARLVTPEQVLLNLRDAGEERITHEEVAHRLNGKLERRRVRLGAGNRVRPRVRPRARGGEQDGGRHARARDRLAAAHAAAASAVTRAGK
jgi:hypothetical protein